MRNHKRAVLRHLSALKKYLRNKCDKISSTFAKSRLLALLNRVEEVEREIEKVDFNSKRLNYSS